MTGVQTCALPISRQGWREHRLSDLVDIKHGFAFKGEFFSDEPTNDVLLTPGNFNIGGGFKGDKFKYYAGEYPVEYALKEGDIIVTMTDLSKSGDTLGYPAKIPHIVGKRYLHNQRLGLLTFKNEDIVERDFLYWLMRNKIYQQFIVSSATGSTVKHTSPSRIKEYVFSAPANILEQRTIAKNLSDLEAKIDLNHQMNKTLEAIAQALFKRWFVDFEFPDAEGRSYKSSGGKMVRSELGPVPAEWRVVPLTELVDVLGGGTPSTGVSSYWDGEIPFFTPKDASEASYVTRTEKTVTQEGLTHCNSPLFPQGTVFITARGTVGKVCMAGVSMVMNQSCYALKGKELRQLYVFFLIKDIAQKLIQQSHGTVFETITTQTFQRTMAIRPEADVVNLFCTKVECLYAQILNNINESASLGTIRDSILPRMMSGKMTVS